MATNGFTLSALPVAPTIPGNVGTFDSEAVRRAQSQQIALYKQLAAAGADREAQQAKLALEAQQATADQGLVAPTAADAAAKLDASTRTSKLRSSVLQEAAPDMQRSGVLSAKADVGAQEATLGQQQNIAALRDRSKSEVADVQKRFKEAANFADHDAEANALEEIERDYPWIAQLPEYKDQHELLKGHITAARQRALDLQKSKSAEERARIIADAGIGKTKEAGNTARDVAQIKANGVADPYERASKAYINATNMAAESEDPDEKEMYEEMARLANRRMEALNAAKAKVGTGTVAGVAAQKMALGARKSLDAAEASFLRTGPLIDRIIPRVTRGGGAGIGSILSAIPESDARSLKADIDTLKANIGFAELNNLRAQSPTGGALGQVSERELAFLQNVIASLDTGLAPDVLRANLARAKEDIAGSLKRLKDAYERDFGAPKESTAGGAAPGADQHVVGQTYTDAAGNKAIYRGPGQWEEVK